MSKAWLIVSSIGAIGLGSQGVLPPEILIALALLVLVRVKTLRMSDRNDTQSFMGSAGQELPLDWAGSNVAGRGSPGDSHEWGDGQFVDLAPLSSDFPDCSPAMSNVSSESCFDVQVVNPATGLPMVSDIGGVDVGGSPFGLDIHDDVTSYGGINDAFSNDLHD